MIRAITLAACLCAAVSVAPLVASAAAAPPASAKPYAVPKNSFGQPDLSGNWTNISMTKEQRPKGLTGAVYSSAQVAEIENAADKYEKTANAPSDPNEGSLPVGGVAEAPGTRPEFAAGSGGTGGYNYGWLDPGTRIGRVHGEPRTAILTTADGQAPKAMTAAEVPLDYRHYKDRADNPEWMSMGDRCIASFGRNAPPPMMPNGFYNNDYKIVQTKENVAIYVEMVHDMRIIPLTAKHRTDGIRPQMGDSIGRYEGNTLVVETTNLPEIQAYHGAWKNLTVTERFTPTAPGRLLYQFTIHDPTMWAADWGGEYEFYPMKGEVYEYACHEGNYALEHMLAGARADERRIAAGAAAPKPASRGQ